MIKSKPVHKVYVVGAGPGDPELLTVKALRLIKSAEVILHDDLVPEGILKFASPKCLLVNCGKRAGDKINQETRQKSIIKALQENCELGKRVVRLKGGDPMIYGRGIEEYAQLKLKNIDVEIVPGISAGLAASSVGFVPLTQRSKVESVLITTASTINEFSREPGLLVSTLKSGNTAILYMGHAHLQQLRKLCSANNIEKDIPIVVASNVSLPDENIVWATLETIEDKISEYQIKRPMVFIIGRNVGKIQLNQENG
jgi:uroporphyrin-III C-methyltransferase